MVDTGASEAAHRTGVSAGIAAYSIWGLFPLAVPLVLFGVAARRIPLTLLGLLQYLTPTGQLLCGVLVLDESLPPARLAGFVLVWIALTVLAVDAWGSGRRRLPAALRA